MPAAPRYNKKARKIAFELIGKPQNMLDFENKKTKKIRKRLVRSDAQWVR
jgi:hypothetical protein